jgi:dihydroceramide fatty acyl 2-hydroxylase
MFQSDLLERFSRVHPTAPFLFWVPVVLFVLGRSVARGDLGPIGISGTFLAGALGWSFAEYVLHRWVFHWQEASPRGRRIHFLLHGVHHDYPDDKWRLVMPLGVSIPLGVVFYALYRLTIGVRFGEPFFAGFVAGYLAYDGIHYAIHHFGMRTRFGRVLKKHHMVHHHVDLAGGFGVSSRLWDYVFRTMPKTERGRP